MKIENYRYFESELNYLRSLPEVEVLMEPYFVELPLLAQIFACLEQWDAFKDYRWLIQSCQFAQAPQTPLDHKTVLLYMSNEDGHLPAESQRLRAVFTPYLRQWPLPQGVHLIPLGANGDIPEVPWIEYGERRLDVWFSGQVLPQRGPFIMEAIDLLYRMQDYPDLQAQIQLTPRFRGGLEPLAYAQTLMDTRIALIPPGMSPITLRLFEAMRSGCLLVCNPLPPFWYLEGLPRLEMPLKWQGLGETLIPLLQDKAYQLKMHQMTIQHYRQRLSPAAIASFIQQQLQALISL